VLRQALGIQQRLAIDNFWDFFTQLSLLTGESGNQKRLDEVMAVLT
jgi:hypothetical protein